MIIVKHRNMFFTITGLIVLASIIAVFVFGLHLGTDFTGGTLIQVSYDGARPDPVALENSIEGAGFKGFSLREYGTSGYILRSATLTNEQRTNLPAIFSLQGNTAHIDQLTEVGPTIGTELRNKALV